VARAEERALFSLADGFAKDFIDQVGADDGLSGQIQNRIDEVGKQPSQEDQGNIHSLSRS